MSKRDQLYLLISGILLIWLSDNAVAATCDGAPGWESREIAGEARHPDAFLHEAGAQTFVLMPFEFGWRIGMLDRDGLEMPVFAAPRHPVETNPTSLAGWHFRNRDNTAPNTGDVNAPQHERRFSFGTLAMDAADPGASPPNEASEGVGGLGILTINEFTLTPPAAGQRAGFTSLTFTVCLIWKGGGDRLAPIVDENPKVAFEAAVATMKGCGLDTALYAVSDRMGMRTDLAQSAYLTPDMDGDKIPDLVVPVSRRDDGAPGLAVCLAGTDTLLLAGFDGRIGRHLDPAYFGRADGWGVYRGPIWPSPEEEEPPHLTADAVRLSKEESSSVILYLTPDLTFSSYWQGD